MIAELFYPKELKEVIKDLREKDDLNEEALRNIAKDSTYRMIIHVFFGLFFLCLGLFFIGKDSFGVTVSIALSLVYFFLAVASITLLNPFVLPYACGDKAAGKIITSNYNYIPGHCIGKHISYEFEDRAGKKRNGRTMGISSSDLIKESDAIEIYYLPSKPSRNVPLLPSMHEKYSLRKVKEKTYE